MHQGLSPGLVGITEKVGRAYEGALIIGQSKASQPPVRADIVGNFAGCGIEQSGAFPKEKVRRRREVGAFTRGTAQQKSCNGSRTIHAGVLRLVVRFPPKAAAEVC